MTTDSKFEEARNNVFYAGLTFLVIAVFVVIVIFAVSEKIGEVEFDSKFHKGEVEIPVNTILLGEKGNPMASVLDLTVPSGGQAEIGFSPRLYNVEGCLTLSLPDNARVVNAATDFIRPDLIQITVLPKVQVCGLQNRSVNVVLWAVK